MKNWFIVKALASGEKSASVYVRGNIGEWGISDNDFIQSINALGNIEQITVNINSNGGDLTMALGMFNYLRNHPAQVTAYIEGVAASAASVLAMACDTIIMPSNSVMMIHNPWTVAMGNANDMEAAAKMLRAFEDTLVTTYSARTNLSQDELKALLDNETWFTASEALDKGFCDQVEDIGENYALAMAKASGIPDEVLAKLAKPQSGLPTEAPTEAPTTVTASFNETNHDELDQSVANLCASANQPELTDSMIVLAKAKGMDSVNLVLAKTALASLSPTGINPVHSATEPVKNDTAASKLAKLSLTAINRKHS
jgi:ATP-dependent protease ClpP protease subunit